MGANSNILADITVFTNDCAGHNMRIAPDFSVVANYGTFFVTNTPSNFHIAMPLQDQSDFVGALFFRAMLACHRTRMALLKSVWQQIQG